MLATRSCCLGSTFADQIIAVFQIDGNFNVIVTSLEQITAAKTQVINTPFGKQLDLMAKSLINVKVETDLTDWSTDFSNIITSLCSDCWTTRHISNFMIKAYQFRKPCLTYQIMVTFTKLINIIQHKLAITYSSLSQAVFINDRSITMPVNFDDLKALRADLLKVLTQQYIAGCLLGNKVQQDFTISQIIE